VTLPTLLRRPGHSRPGAARGERSRRPWLAGALAFALAATVSAPLAAQSSASDDAFTTALAELREAGFADKEAVVDRLVAIGHRNTAAVLTAMLEDRLYYRSADQQVVVTTTTDDGSSPIEILDPVTLRSVGRLAPDAVVKIGTNNRLRRFLRTAVARFALASPDASIRLHAVQEREEPLSPAVSEMP